MSSSGVPELDELLAGGLHEGDNVVWVDDDGRTSRPFVRAFLTVPEAASRRVVVTSAAALAALPDVDHELLDARPRRVLADPIALERALVDRPGEPGARIVVDSLDDLVRRWGVDRAVAFFSRVCPQLFDADTIAYWTASRAVVPSPAIEQIRRVTQCVFECTTDRLRIAKAEGRPSRVQGTAVSLRVERDGRIVLGRELAVGRLAEGLRRIRRERQLTQAELARMAGVSPSALSQAEAGHRGLSLDTLLVLTERLGIGLDDLLGRPPRVDHVLVRRTRGKAPGPVTAMLNDPRLGLRLRRIELGPGEQGAPPAVHKGAELILVASGLVMVDLGTTTPVLRAGDAVLVTQIAVTGWRNLLAEPAVMYWVLRDETPVEDR